MRRRRFLGSLAAAGCPGAIAQQPAERARIVVVHPASVEESTVYQRLVPGLAQLGHVQGKSLTLDLRSANGVTSALPKLVADAIATQPRMIIVVGPAAVRVAVEATKTLPIVAVDLESDPVANGWMRTLSRPGTNVTGLFLDLTGMSLKWLQLQRDAVPGVRDVAFLWDAATAQAQLAATREAAARQGIGTRTIAVDGWRRFEPTMSAAIESRPSAIVVLSSPVAFQFSAPIAQFTTRHRLPAISPFRPFTQAGGLMSYGPDLELFFAHAGHRRSHPAGREPRGDRRRATGEVRARHQRRGRTQSRPQASARPPAARRRGHPLISRRTFVACAVLVSLTACGPSETRKRIGFLEAGSESANRHFVDAFRKGMREMGYEEGRNMALDVRWAEGRAERFPEMLGQLVKGKPDVIVVASSLGAVAAHKVVKTTPVVFVGVSDPVALGIVAELAHPGGNMTGLSRVFGEGLLGKALEALREIVPGATRIAILYNPEGAVEPRVAEAQAAMHKLGLTPLLVAMRDERSLDEGFDAMRAQRVDAMLVVTDPLTLRHRDRIVKGAADHRIPAVYEFAEFARAGGLVAYSASIPALFERAATYVDKILKGARPGDLPVEQPTKFELVVNERAARDLGLAVPQALLLRADEKVR